MSRSTAAGGSRCRGGAGKAKEASANKLEEYIKTRDYTGALALLEFNRKVGEDDELHTLLWIGYCASTSASTRRPLTDTRRVSN